MMRRIALMAAGVALVAAACGSGSAEEAEVVPAPPPATEQSTAEADTRAEDEGNNEGIEVHGHWKIVVTNPDGSVASTTEFENALTTEGATLLAGLLTGGREILEGAIDLTVASETLAGCEPDPVTQGTPPYFEVAARVQVDTVAEWTASFTALNDDVVTSVSTCTTPSLGKFGPSLTEKILDAPVPIVTDQEIEATVEISFS